MHKHVVRMLGTVAAGALAMSVIGSPASAKPPTQVSETYTSVVCEAWRGDVKVVVGASQSIVQVNDDPAETLSGSGAQVSRDGETLGRSEDTPSAWTESSFRVNMPVTDNDDNVIGELYFSGSYKATGTPEVSEERTKDGNRRVVFSSSNTELGLSDVVVQLDGAPFDVASCAGSVEELSFNFTNPQMVVQRFSQLSIGDCVTTGQLRNPFIHSFINSLEELYVESQVGDNEALLLRGLIDASSGSWSGNLELSLDGEHVDFVSATATLTRMRPFHETDKPTQYQVTPYLFSVDAGSVGSFTCPIFSVKEKGLFVNASA